MPPALTPYMHKTAALEMGKWGPRWQWGSGWVHSHSYQTAVKKSPAEPAVWQWPCKKAEGVQDSVEGWGWWVEGKDPPMACMSSITYFPEGFKSHRKGTWATRLRRGMGTGLKRRRGTGVGLGINKQPQ